MKSKSNNSANFFIKQETGEKFNFSSMYQQLPQWKSGGQILSFLTLIDVDGDQIKELLFQFFQLQEEFGKMKDPSLSNLVKIYKLKDGVPQDITEKIFSQSAVQLEGSGASLVYDINQDGKEDWFIASSKEDGRPYPAENNFGPTIAVISQLDGTYKIINSSKLDWHGAIGLSADNGEVSVITTGWHGSEFKKKYTSEFTFLYQSYVYKYIDSELKLEMGPPLNPSDFLEINNFINGKKSYLTSAFSNNNSNKYYYHLVGWTGNDWVILDNYESNVKFMYSKPFISWQKNFITETNIYKIGDIEIGDLRFDYIDHINISGESSYILVGAGSCLFDLDKDGIYEANGTGISAIEVVKVINNKLVKQNIYSIDSNGNYSEINYLESYSEILDINKDGIDDIVSNPYSKEGNPILHLGIGNGYFIKMNEDFFPMPDGEMYYWGEHAKSRFIDINLDGVYDLLYWAGNGVPVDFPYNKEPVIFYGSSNNYGEYIKTNIKIEDRKGAPKIVTFGGNDYLKSDNSALVTMVDMGDGIDISEYNINSNSKSVKKDANFKIFHQNGGYDILVNVERVKFNDKYLALDLTSDAGEVAKILGAVFGKNAIKNEEYFGIGLYYKDKGMKYADLGQLAVSAAGLNSYDALVSQLWFNIVGTKATEMDKAPYINLLKNGMNVGDLVVFAAETELNKVNIDLIGLSSTGALYQPFGG